MRNRTKSGKVINTKSFSLPKEAAPEKEEDGTTELPKLMAAIKSRYGNNAMTTAREAPSHSRLEVGVFMLDFALLGGIPENQITHIFGEKSSGKTTVACKIAASAQRKYPEAKTVVLDVEGTFDTDWAEKNGVNIDKMLVVRPDTGEQAVDMAHSLLKAREVSLLIVDSVAALTPFKELDVSAEDSLVGQQARLVARMVRTCTQSLSTERKRGHFVTIVLLNQFRAKIGGMHANARTLPGGRILEFAASCQLLMRNKEIMGRDDAEVELVKFNDHSFSVEKNKTGNGLRNGEFRLLRDPTDPRGEGFVDDAETVVLYAKRLGLLTGGGSVQRLIGVAHPFKRMADVAKHLEEHPKEYRRITSAIVEAQRKRMKVRK